MIKRTSLRLPPWILVNVHKILQAEQVTLFLIKYAFILKKKLVGEYKRDNDITISFNRNGQTFVKSVLIDIIGIEDIAFNYLSYITIRVAVEDMNGRGSQGGRVGGQRGL